MIRIGQGEDIHILAEGRKLVLGGVTIPFEKGLLGHSDADVVFHAVADSLLGALALGDIGQYFPTDDPKWEGADSSLILKEVVTMVKGKGFHINNIDVMVSAERPKLMPYIANMRENLAKLLEISEDCVGIQAMTNEKMDAVGEGKAIRANCVCLLEDR